MRRNPNDTHTRISITRKTKDEDENKQDKYVHIESWVDMNAKRIKVQRNNTLEAFV